MTRFASTSTKKATNFQVTFRFFVVITQVWVIKGDVGKKLEDIPAPFSDVKNILKEIEFKDETTRSRCKGWLILPSRKYLQADILFPGCAFDCRLNIRGRIGTI